MGNNNRVSVNVDFKANISAFQSSLQLMKNGLAQLKLPNNLKDSFTKTFNQLENEIKNFQNLTSSGKMTVVNEKAIAKSQSQIKRLFDTIKNDFSKAGIQDAGFDKITKQVDLLNKKYEKFQQNVNNTDLGKQVKDAESNLKRLRKKLASESAEVTNIIQTKADKTAADQKFKQEQDAIEKVILQYQRYEKYKALLDENGKINVDKVLSTVTEDSNYPTHMKELAKNLGLAKAEADNANAAFNGLGQTLDNALSNKRKVEIEVKDAEDNLKKLKDDLEKLSSQEFDKFKQSMATSADTQNLLDWSKIINAKDYENAVNKLISEGNAEAAKVLMDLAQAAQKGGQAVDDAGKKIDKGADSLQKLGEREQDIQRLYNQLTQFFSISSAVQIFRRMVNSSIDAIKELDAAMTEVAVVTDFSVGDMWNQLPDYTTKANELGLAISDVYNASALYYQQGLDTAEVNSMVTSTLQMARIAGLDAAVATDRMTNAMRGFNMEINEANASHVADVYSNLAAKSASNVKELSVAMTKTASIAYSANMQFENVAAFLAQGIETTRESADTIGTMLKTVIGRFTEVKKAWSEGELKAEIDGEEINVNNVSKALRTAGINMNDFFTGARGLDEIFIELSSKWDSLDLVTQRYIATQAAGSRQQSRFIALMQDYSRQQELIGYAYNSSGAAQEQYEKTLDSLESKLNQLKNAWDRFTMGIANNQLVKFVVGALTQILNVINNITDKLGPAGSMISKLGITIAALFGGGKLLKGLFGKVAGTFLGENSDFVKNFIQSGQEGGQGLIKGLKSILSNIDFKEAFSGFKNTSGNFQQIWDKSFNIKDNQLKDQIQNDLKNINENNYNTEAIEEFNEKYEELGITLDANAIKEEKTKATAQAMGVALMGVATVCGLISTALAKTGNTGAAEAFQKIATAAGIAGTAITTIAPAIASLEGAVPILLVISAAIMAIVAAISFYDAANESAEEKTERLANSLKSAQEAAKDSKKAYEDLKSSIESLNDSQNALDGLVEGTREFQEALIATNQEVLNLLETYPQLAKYLTTNKYGGLDITSQGLASIQEQQLEAANRAQANALTAQIAVNIDKQNNANKNYSNSFRTTDEWGNSTQSNQLQAIFEQAYTDWKNSGTNAIDGLNSIVSSLESAKADTNMVIDLQGFDSLESLVQSWMSLYESNEASKFSTEAENENLIRSIYQTSLSDEVKNSKFASLLKYQSAKDAETIGSKAQELKETYTNKNGDAGGEISQLALDLKNDFGKYADILSEERKALITDTSGGIGTYQQIYEALIGIKPEEDKSVSELATEIGNVLASYDSMNNAESLINYMEEFAQRNETAATNLTNLLSHSLNAEQLSKIINRDETRDRLTDLLEATDQQMRELAQEYGFIDKGIKDLDTTDKNSEEYQIIQEGLNNFIDFLDKEAQKQKKLEDTQRAEAAAQFMGYGANLDKKQVQFLAELEISDLTNLQEIASRLESVLSPAIANSLLEGLNSEKIKLKDIDWLKDLDATNAVESYSILNKKIQEVGNSNEDLSNFYKNLQSQFGESKQFKQVFADISEDLSEIYEKNGEITSDNVDELASSSATLNKFLKSTGMSASILAKTLTGIKDKKIHIQGLTDSVLKSLSSFKSLDDEVSILIDRLGQITDIDLGNPFETVKSWTETLQEYADNFEWGNMVDILSNFFPEVTQGLASNPDANTQVENYFNQFKKYTADEGWNLLEEMQTQNKMPKWMKSFEDGIINWDYDSISNLSEMATDFKSAVKEATGLEISDDMAKAYTTLYLGKDAQATALYNERQTQLAVQELSTDRTSGKYSKEEIDAISEAFGVSSDEVLKQLGVDKDDLIQTIDDLGNEISGADLRKQLWDQDSIKYDKESGGQTRVNSITGEKDKTYDYDELTQKIREEFPFFSETQVQQYAEAQAAETGAQLSQTRTYMGEEITVFGDSKETLEQNMQDAIDAVKTDVLATNIGNSVREAIESALKNAAASGVFGEEIRKSILEQEASTEGATEFTKLAPEDSQQNLQNQLQVEGTATVTVESSDQASKVLDYVEEQKENIEKSPATLTLQAEGSDVVLSDLQQINEALAVYKALGDQDSQVKIVDENGEIQGTASNVQELNDKLAAVPPNTQVQIIDQNGSALTELQRVEQLSSTISALPTSKDIQINVTYNTTGAPPKLGGGVRLYGTAHASGMDRTSRDETALTGEMGQEMVVTGDHWYTVGDHGPEFTHIPAGSIVFNARQTHDLLTKGHTNTHGRAWANGTAFANRGSKIGKKGGSFGGSSGSSSASAASSAASAAESAGEAAKAWINTLDKLYNLVQTIEEETRRRELLEKKYEKLLRTQNLTLINLRDNYKSQLQSFNKSLEYQKQLQKGRLDQINDVGNERYKMGDNVTTYAGSGATSYAKYNQSTNTIEIDWNAINGITDEDLGSAVEAYIKRLEELQDQYEDTYSEILEIETQIYELQQTYKEGYADFSQRVYDALVAQEEKRIENLEKVYSQISDDNSKILDELQEQIELERQIRDNTEKEKEIADKENQLAYLRRDTSNGNLLEIKKLEEELQDLREDYTDALIDQKLDKLSDDNEKAAAQRDLQIEQLNSILEYNKEHGTFWGNVESLMLSAFNPDGSLNNNSTLVALLKDTDAFASMSSVSGDIWMKELASAFHISAEGLEQWKIEDATNKAKEEIKSGIAWQNATGVKVENGATVHYNPSTGKWSTGPNDPWAWDLEYDAITGKYKNINGIQNKKPNQAPATQPQTQTNSGNWNNRTATSLGNHVNVHATPNGQVVRQVNFGNRFEVNGEQQDGWVRVRVQHNGRDLSEGWDYGWIRQEWVKYDRYAKGGLADFTGPAWLDGSKTHPELVLNARDTENFIALKDILAESLRGSSTLNTNNNGDNYFNISITVDELSNDYDVEQLASKIKEEITKDAKYRNVNTLNFLR